MFSWHTPTSVRRPQQKNSVAFIPCTLTQGQADPRGRGDMPYATDFSSATAMPNWVAELNASSIQFVAHFGDFKGGSDSCSDTRMTTTQGLLQPTECALLGHAR